ncbi:hypothetical protein CKAH01_01243 [Colletotrichum kahawae]|uniref:Uncharacterized protein n=1 Tax=Colletotrichum kahawae TaxID=34407 RepID=A0AAE0D4U9_COLKA|nr:hypothetical protein CKAH01_01243 [Colletotrichum kahawae]
MQDQSDWEPNGRRPIPISSCSRTRRRLSLRHQNLVRLPQPWRSSLIVCRGRGSVEPVLGRLKYGLPQSITAASDISPLISLYAALRRRPLGLTRVKSPKRLGAVAPCAWLCTPYQTVRPQRSPESRSLQPLDLFPPVSHVTGQ